MIPPRENPHLIGHLQAEATLVASTASGRLAHAWLLLGPRGVGKATLGFRFARFLLAGGHAPPAHAGSGLFSDTLPAPETPDGVREIFAQHKISTVHSEEATLEDIFIEITGRGLSE